MTGARNDRTFGRWAQGLAAAAILLTLVVASGAAGAVATRSAAPTVYPTLSWANGEVLCTTDPSMPSATVTASGDAGAGLQMGIGNISQENLLGVAAATADLTSASWTVTNLSGAADYAVVYTASVPVTETALLGILGVQIGSVSVAVTIELGVYGANAPLPADAYVVSMEMNISGWPWVPSIGAGPLVAELAVSPALASVVHLTAGTGNATVAAVNATGATMAYLSLGASANVTSSHGVLTVVPILGELLSMASTSAVVEVNFTSAATGASAMNYTSEAVVEPAAVGHPRIPPTVQLPGAPPIPTVDFVAVGGAAVLASLAIAGGARRARRSSSNLEYVTEEEEA